MFPFYCSLYPGGSLGNLQVREQVAIAKRTYPRRKRHCRFNLVISHVKRQAINKLIWDNHSFGKEILESPLSDELVGGVFVGMPLIANLTQKGLIHGAFLQVLSWNAEKVQLKDIESLEEIELPVTSLKTLRAGWALTYCSSQGRTLRDCCLWDCNHPRFTSKHLAMGLGRGVSDRLVCIA